MSISRAKLWNVKTDGIPIGDGIEESGESGESDEKVSSVAAGVCTSGVVPLLWLYLLGDSRSRYGPDSPRRWPGISAALSTWGTGTPAPVRGGDLTTVPRSLGALLPLYFFLFFPSMQWLLMSFRFSAVVPPSPSAGTNTILGILLAEWASQGDSISLLLVAEAKRKRHARRVDCSSGCNGGQNGPYDVDVEECDPNTRHISSLSPVGGEGSEGGEGDDGDCFPQGDKRRETGKLAMGSWSISRLCGEG